ncbi:hypothetical protein R3P38DRAFT_2790667 [Favolaschia claudopus]|uniref:Uncharacterized protein n=1 Tax=Favolaschia claudopus TaxID=2862362 RepID=A0AAW0AHZ3_9AGAR
MAAGLTKCRLSLEPGRPLRRKLTDVAGQHTPSYAHSDKPVVDQWIQMPARMGSFHLLLPLRRLGRSRGPGWNSSTVPSGSVGSLTFQSLRWRRDALVVVVVGKKEETSHHQIESLIMSHLDCHSVTLIPNHDVRKFYSPAVASRALDGRRYEVEMTRLKNLLAQHSERWQSAAFSHLALDLGHLSAATGKLPRLTTLSLWGGSSAALSHWLTRTASSCPSSLSHISLLQLDVTSACFTGSGKVDGFSTGGAELTVSRVFDSLTLPSLTRLDINSNTSDSALVPWPTPEFISFAARSSFGTNLKLLACLHHLPSLEHLAIADIPTLPDESEGSQVLLTTSLLTALTQNAKSLVPRLSGLLAHSMLQFDDQALLRFVLSRVESVELFEIDVFWIACFYMEMDGSVAEKMDEVENLAYMWEPVDDED